MNFSHTAFLKDNYMLVKQKISVVFGCMYDFLFLLHKLRRRGEMELGLFCYLLLRF